MNFIRRINQIIVHNRYCMCMTLLGMYIPISANIDIFAQALTSLNAHHSFDTTFEMLLSSVGESSQ